MRIPSIRKPIILQCIISRVTVLVDFDEIILKTFPACRDNRNGPYCLDSSSSKSVRDCGVRFYSEGVKL